MEKEKHEFNFNLIVQVDIVFVSELVCVLLHYFLTCSKAITAAGRVIMVKNFNSEA